MIHPLFTQFNEDLGNGSTPGGRRRLRDLRGATATRSPPSSRERNVGRSEGLRREVAHRFFPNILPYEVGTPATFGFVAWNGRSLTDNAPDVMFSIAANAPVRLGIGKES